MKSPRISVIMPAFNRENFIAESMSSVLTQSYEDFELIVIDDGSTDRTVEIASQFADDPRVSIVRNEENMGIARTRNKGLKLAQAEYIALLDSDDIWVDRDKLNKQVEFLDSHPEYALIGGGIRHIDPHGRELKDVIFEQEDAKIRKAILRHNPFAQSSLMYRKQAALSCGAYDPEYRVCDDYNLWLCMGTKYKFANFGEIFTGYRIHGGNITRTKRLTAASEILEIIRKYSRDYPGANLGIIKGYVRLIAAYFRS